MSSEPQTDGVVSAPTVEPPEPDLTPAELIARAAALRGRLLEEAEDAAARGGYSAEMHAEFTAAGFYRVLQPRRFGGYEMGLDTYLRMVIEIGRGDPGTAWGMGLAGGHAMHLASYFDESAQARAFGPDGHFVCPQRGIPSGKATRVEGGYRVGGRWEYASGVTHANWFMAAAFVDERSPIAFLVPREEIKVLDDWGGDSTIGLQASGSNSVVIEDAFVPEQLTDRFDWTRRELDRDGTIGYRLHGNPLYLGRPLAYFACEVTAPVVGAAWAALDEYEALLHGRNTSFPPLLPRTRSPFFQEWWGEAVGRVDAAQALLLAAATAYTDQGRAWAEEGAPFGSAEDARIRQLAAHAGRLAWSAIELMFSTGGSSAAKGGSRLQRYYRDISMFRTHIAAQWPAISQSAGLASLGEAITL